MKTPAFIILLFALSFNLAAQEVNIIPKPVAIELGKKDTFFKLNNTTQIYISNDSLRTSADYLNTYLEKYYGFQLSIITTLPTNKENVISLIVAQTKVPIPNYYALSVKQSNIYIRAKNKQCSVSWHSVLNTIASYK